MGPMAVWIGMFVDWGVRNITRHTLQNHIHNTETVIENFTSPAARNPYAGINAMIQISGFTILIHVTM